ncbi:MAG: O-antigen ligase family protein [Desulfotomaculum sp.]|nr:O-antigen ligase family protein [Desulfotomaculum sp.]
MGTWEFRDAVLWGWTSRISSVFQYPNTLASFIVSAIFINLILALKTYYSKENKVSLVKNSLITSMYIAAAAVLFSVFILTYSRGAWLVFALVYIVALILLPLKDKLPFLVFTAISALPSIYVFIKAKPIMDAIFQVNVLNKDMAIPAGGWQALLAAVAAAAVIAFIYSLINHYSKTGTRKLIITQLATAAVICVLAALFIPTALDMLGEKQEIFKSVQNRLEAFKNIDENNSASARLVFYEDAAKIFKDNLILGAGGGAWRSLFEKYQSYSYYSTEAHIYYLQLAAETGIVGIIALLAIIISFVTVSGYLYWKNRNKNSIYPILAVVAAFLVLMGHSALDFNMSFSVYAAAIWILLAVVFYELKIILSDSKQPENKWQIQRLINNINKAVISTKTYAIVLASIAFLTVIFNAMPVMALNAAKQAGLAYKNKSYVIAINKLKDAYELDSLNTEYVISYAESLYSTAAMYEDKKIQQLKRQEAIRIMEELSKKVPYSSKVKLKLAMLYAKNGNSIKAIKELDKAIKIAPYNAHVYNNKIIYSYNLAEHMLLKENNQEKAVQYLTVTLNCYDKMLEVQEELKKKGTLSSNRPFRISNEAYLYTAKAKYLTGDYKEAAILLNIAEKDESLRDEVAVWLAAVYKKLYNKEDYPNWHHYAEKLNKNYKERIEEISQLPVLDLKN